MLRITTLADDGQNVRLKVEGRIVANWVTEIKNVCTSLLAQKKIIFLDFSNVSFIDRQGVKVLQKVLSGRVEIFGASRLVQALLESGLTKRHPRVQARNIQGKLGESQTQKGGLSDDYLQRMWP